MGMPMLKRFMSMQSERRHRQIRARARAGCVSSSLAKRKKEVCQHDDVSPSDKRLRCSGVNLPEVPPADMLPSKFLHLRDFCLSLPGRAVSPAYDYFSVVPLLDSCPSLETFCLNASHDCVGHETTNSEDPSHPRQIPGQHHGKLRSMTILGFCSATSLVELTCYIVEMAALTLECLTLNVHVRIMELANSCPCTRVC
ncbi:uncharacterized protein [Aegilops tauschii subsp. strangulata]|uniref:uncharacterized protein isoform X3 n=1 Tax=Aegilops tauschii subsp. strangulata TaxID=200361 RepID=UPI001ABC9F1A|nr:uncharacterized protein LOC109760183 isoform X3 [Aegilops tauschii subsp. strangulata]